MTANDIELTNFFSLTAEPKGRFNANYENTLINHPRGGSRLVSQRINEKRIEIDFYSNEKNPIEIKKILSLLPTTFNVKFSDYPDFYWQACFDGDLIIYRELNNTNEYYGSFSFLVPDGLAHSISTKTFTSSEKTLTLINDGTAPTPLKVTVNSKSDNGFVGLSLVHGTDVNASRIYQIGVPGETDYTPDTREEWLVNDLFNKTVTPEKLGDWQINPNNALELMEANYPKGTWKVGGAFKFSDRTSPKLKFPGNVSIDTVPSMSNGQWGGPVLVGAIKADSSGSADHKNWQVGYNFKWMSGAHTDFGCAQYLVVDSTGKTLMGVILFKDSLYYASRCVFIVEGKEVRNVVFTPSTDKNNPIGSWENPELILRKMGTEYLIKIGGVVYSYQGTENTSAKYLVCALGNNGGFSGVTENFVQTATFRKQKVPYEKDVPNFLADGDALVVDAKTNTSTVNGYPALNYVDIASQPLLLQPGTSQLVVTTSSFATQPEIIAEYSERWK